jgi:hypothetical protein
LNAVKSGRRRTPPQKRRVRVSDPPNDAGFGGTLESRRLFRENGNLWRPILLSRRDHQTPRHLNDPFNVTLDDKYTLQEGRVFLTGTQALVRMPMMQHLRDKAAGANTACYISGYRGSPLGGYDQQLWAAKKLLAEHDIVFQPGVNEDLAATACWGTQQAHFEGDNKYDGVFAIWYGKGRRGPHRDASATAIWPDRRVGRRAVPDGR